MERLIQYLDELEDIVYIVALQMERIRRAVRTLVILVVSAALQILGILLALGSPPLGLAAVFLAAVLLLYRAVVTPIHASPSG